MYRSIVLFGIVFCVPAWAIQCNVGEYAQGEHCVACPDAYPHSLPDADSIDDCYLVTKPGEYVDVSGLAPVKCTSNHYCPGNLSVFYDLHRRYVNVDYIAGTGTQYIDTGIILGSDIDTKLVFETGYISSVEAALFGATNTANRYWVNGFANNIYI